MIYTFTIFDARNEVCNRGLSKAMICEGLSQDDCRHAVSGLIFVIGVPVVVLIACSLFWRK